MRRKRVRSESGRIEGLSVGISTCANRCAGICGNIDLCNAFSCTSRNFDRLFSPTPPRRPCPGGICGNIDLCKPFSFTIRVSDRLFPPGFRDGSAKAQTAILPAVVAKTNEADISQKGTLPIDYAPPWGAYQEIRSPRCFITCATTRYPGSHALSGSSRPRAVPFRPAHRRRGQVVSVHSAASPMSMWASTCAFFDKTFSRVGRMYTLGCFQCTFCRSTFVHIAIYLRFCTSNIFWGRQNVH